MIYTPNNHKFFSKQPRMYIYIKKVLTSNLGKTFQQPQPKLKNHIFIKNSQYFLPEWKNNKQ